MQLFYGSYAFPANAASVKGRMDIISNAMQRPIRRRLYFDVEFSLFGDGDNDISQRQIECRDALAVPYQNLVLRTNSGAVSSASLVDTQTLTGVWITSGPHFGGTTQGEWVTLTEGKFTACAEALIAGGDKALVDWSETFSRQGNGGPNIQRRFPVNTNYSIAQVITPVSLVRVTQTGTAVGHLDYPTPPRPRWNNEVINCLNPAESIVYGNPKRTGKLKHDFPVSWTYIYESDILFMGLPTPPPFSLEFVIPG